MKTVTIYNKNTGEILRSFSGSEELIKLNVKDNEDYVEGGYTKDNEKVVDGVITLISDEEIESRALEAAWQAFKTGRNLMLQDCDWTQLPDAPVNKDAWASYRQALRDLPDNTLDVRNVIWPTPPNAR
jgi:hypothetical protein